MAENEFEEITSDKSQKKKKKTLKKAPTLVMMKVKYILNVPTCVMCIITFTV